MKSPTPESVLALVLDELTRDRQNNGDFATHGGGRKFLADELQRLTTHIVNPVPGMTVKQQKQAIAWSAIRLAALAVRFVLDLRLDRYLDLEPVPKPLGWNEEDGDVWSGSDAGGLS